MDSQEIVLQALKEQTDERLLHLTLKSATTPTQRQVKQMAAGVLEHRKNARKIWAELLIDDALMDALRFINGSK